jgi:hypothetical protein
MLILFVKTAFNRTTTFIAEHKQSVCHELDRTFLDTIYTAQHQLRLLEEHPCANAHADIIAQIKEELTTIEEKYKKNSPGLMLLGPIGSAAIVAKEEKLQQKLLAVLNELGTIFTTINNPDLIFTPAETINTALHNNKRLLQTIVA